MTGNVIIKPSVQQRFDGFMQRGRVLFFSAPCGFGKTALAEALLRGRNVLRLDALSADFSIAAGADGWDILLIDDMQLMQEEHDWQTLCELIRANPERRFILLSRGTPPGCLMAFQYTGLMTVLTAEDLFFDHDDIRKLFASCEAEVTDSEVNSILKESIGYPLGAAIAAQLMSGGRPFSPRAGAMLDRLLSSTTMLRYDDARHCGKTDAAGKQARSRLAWLDIALPQRGVEELAETFPAVFRLMTNKEISLPAFSVTSTLPSVMNGGKDFSEWSRRDELLYQTLRTPVEAVLGKDGVGLADCAIAESRFEKGENISGRMLSLIPRTSEIRQRGTPDIEFAVNALLARSLLSGGQSGDARRTIETLRTRFAAEGQERFMPNMDALLCRIALHTGDLDAADGWYRESAPRDPMHVDVMKRCRYFTQAMVELADGRPDAALLTLAPLETYIKSCARHIDGIHLNVLSAIALYRGRDEAWRQRLTAAMDTAAEYRFIRPISVYGAAVLPLLERLEWNGSARWKKQLMAGVRAQAAFYPRFLQTRLARGEALTPTELQILHLICADKSNAEIGQIMDIKLHTVKTHVSHILDKLGVKRRSEARTAARKLRLISEE